MCGSWPTTRTDFHSVAASSSRRFAGSEPGRSDSVTCSSPLKRHAAATGSAVCRARRSGETRIASNAGSILAMARATAFIRFVPASVSARSASSPLGERASASAWRRM